MNRPDPIIEKPSAPSDAAKSSFRRPAIIVSILFHIALIVVLLFWYLPKRQPSASPAMAAQSSSNASGDQSSAAKPPPPAPVAEVPPEQIEKSIESQIEQVKKLPDEKKLSELERNLRRLESVASKESVEEVSTKIASTLGLNHDQYAAKETPAAGPFDTSTGQLQDVTRTRNQSGAWQYQSVLVDAEGRTMTVPMTAAEGETVYNTFQQIKKFPWAEGIYRSVVMPLMQKMLAAEEVAQKAAMEAARMQQADPTERENDEVID